MPRQSPKASARKAAVKTRRAGGRSELEQIPGVGPSIAADFGRIGITRVAELKHNRPQQLYDDLCAVDGVKHDRCVLYVFRCAVYYASTPNPDPEKLKWWNWKTPADNASR